MLGSFFVTFHSAGTTLDYWVVDREGGGGRIEFGQRSARPMPHDLKRLGFAWRFEKGRQFGERAGLT